MLEITGVCLISFLNRCGDTNKTNPVSLSGESGDDEFAHEVHEMDSKGGARHSESLSSDTWFCVRRLASRQNPFTSHSKLKAEPIIALIIPLLHGDYCGSQQLYCTEVGHCIMKVFDILYCYNCCFIFHIIHYVYNCYIDTKHIIEVVEI